MKKVIMTTALLCLFPFSTGYAWQGRVLKVLDGDVRKTSKAIYTEADSA